MTDQPNLLFLMPDQLRPDFLGCYGGRSVSTPNIDSLAERGITFRQAYSQHPVCVPARASLMLGMHALRTGVLDNGHWIRPDYRACGLKTWPELLSEQGYYTAAIGKMHFYPWDLRLGFQYRSIAEDKRWLYVRDDYFSFLHERGHRKYHGNEHDGYFDNKGAIVNLLPWELQPDHWVGDEACRFVEQHGRDGPFAMMVGFPGPHCPYDPDPRYLDRVDDAGLPEPVPNAGNSPLLRERVIAGNRNPWNGVDYTEFTRDQKMRIRKHYAAEVAQIDEAIGRILSALRAQRLEENTIVVLASDHGDLLGDHDLIGKSNFFEASCHVPMLVAGPAVDCRLSDDLVALTDVTATLVARGTGEVPPFMDARPLPGVGVEGATGRDQLVGALSDGWMIQRDGWRYSKYVTGETLLFDLREDPAEQVNRFQEPGCADVVKELDARLTGEVMRGLSSSQAPQHIGVGADWQSQAFGREGWTRIYPQRV